MGWMSMNATTLSSSYVNVAGKSPRRIWQKAHSSDNFCSAKLRGKARGWLFGLLGRRLDAKLDHRLGSDPLSARAVPVDRGRRVLLDRVHRLDRSVLSLACLPVGAGLAR